MNNEPRVNIIGAGLAGLSAAYALAREGVKSRLISLQASERAQSNLAEGGINAVLNVMDENDTIDEHFADTIAGGCNLANPDMVWALVKNAPDIIDLLIRLGVPFNKTDGRIIQRNFGGQKKKRTAFVKSSTGKMVTTALINAVRKYECNDLVERLCHHEFLNLLLSEGDNRCVGVSIRDIYSERDISLPGPVIICCGGLNGFFHEMTTGTTANTGNAAARLFLQGVEFSNLEFIQYHPTTVGIPQKRLLISEAARGEGARLFHEREKSRVYFMEDKYGPEGNLMPRDVVSREMALLPDNTRVYLDMTMLSKDIWENRLSDLRDELIKHLHKDPSLKPIPVRYGIHYFMGGIMVDESHRTNIEGLYAAGECTCAYHGANRLGGNSLLGAIHGGISSANSIIKAEQLSTYNVENFIDKKISGMSDYEVFLNRSLSEILLSGLSILRDENKLSESLKKIEELFQSNHSEEFEGRLLLGKAMLESASKRHESRGAHTRTDYPKSDDKYLCNTISVYKDDSVSVSFRHI